MRDAHLCYNVTSYLYCIRHFLFNYVGITYVVYLRRLLFLLAFCFLTAFCTLHSSHSHSLRLLVQPRTFVTPTTTCRTGAKGRSQQPRGFRHRRKWPTIEKSEQINEICFLRKHPQNYMFPLGWKFASDRQLTLDLRNCQLSRSVTEARSLAGLAAYAYAHTCSPVALSFSEDQ